MLKTFAQTVAKVRLSRVMTKLFILAILTMLLAMNVPANRVMPVGGRTYGGRGFYDFVSCGSSAGNYAYTCAEGGGCYVNESINADDYC